MKRLQYTNNWRLHYPFYMISIHWSTRAILQVKQLRVRCFKNSTRWIFNCSLWIIHTLTSLWLRMQYINAKSVLWSFPPRMAYVYFISPKVIFSFCGMEQGFVFIYLIWLSYCYLYYVITSIICFSSSNLIYLRI